MRCIWRTKVYPATGVGPALGGRENRGYIGPSSEPCLLGKRLAKLPSGQLTGTAAETCLDHPHLCLVAGSPRISHNMVGRNPLAGHTDESVRESSIMHESQR